MNNISDCVTCLYNYTINDNHEKICLREDDSKCSTRNIIKGKCNEKIYDKQIKEVYNILREDIKEYNDKVICTENVIFEMTLLNEQDKKDIRTSYVDLGECENRIKKAEHLSDDDELIIFKIDMKNDDSTLLYVQYEIYNPNTLDLISLDICRDILINIDIPFDLTEPTKSLYIHMNESGYNLFNINDSFYNDICSTYTTQNNTDLSMADRKNVIFDKKGGNMKICQNGCELKYYNITNKKAKCECEVQREEIKTEILGIQFEELNIVDDFYQTIVNSNFLVLKCYQLVFSLKGQINNIGSYIMLVFIFLLFILFVIYIFKGQSKIIYYINVIAKQKFFQIEDYKISKFNSKRNSVNELKRIKSDDKEKNNNNKLKIKRLSATNKIKKRTSLFRKSINNKKKSISKNIKMNNSTSTLKNLSHSVSNPKSKSKNKINQIISPRRKKSINNSKKNNININKKGNNILNDEEINNLEYKYALLKDKRTYMQYYCSLLKKKQLLLFTFFPNNDYNLTVVKLSIFLVSFSLYFTTNGFFFSDKTMNKINQDNGEYNFISQIAIIFYSSLISSAINNLLKFFSLSEKKILELKKESNYKKFRTQSNKTRNSLKIKCLFFFLFSFLLMLFFWYFISCFCAVFKNTQIILIEDTLISFAISMIYPFGLDLIPGIFRISALRAPKKDKNNIYKISLFVALLI